MIGLGITCSIGNLIFVQVASSLDSFLLMTRRAWWYAMQSLLLPFLPPLQTLTNKLGIFETVGQKLWQGFTVDVPTSLPPRANGMEMGIKFRD